MFIWKTEKEQKFKRRIQPRLKKKRMCIQMYLLALLLLFLVWTFDVVVVAADVVGAVAAVVVAADVVGAVAAVVVAADVVGAVALVPGPVVAFAVVVVAVIPICRMKQSIKTENKLFVLI